ncbi:MAG TPA: MFS transporter [Woeseiaceae bacterium]|nr:MFS transporter [Woeseiaceae bacterium]
MKIPTDLRAEIRWLSSGFLLMLYSGFGQTYYIAVFAGQLKSELTLTDGEFGGLYTIGTLASAALLTWAGRLADTISIRWLGAGVIAGLAVTSAAMALATTPLMLAAVLFGLRFFGQGMCTHTAMTAMGRWFNRKRGRAVSIAGLGLPASEAVLPALAVAASALVGWRQTWLASSALLLVAALPAFVVLLEHERHPTRGPMAAAASDPASARHHWTRSEVLRDARFYGLLPGLLAPPFIVTAIFFNQVTLVDLKQWDLAWFAATFPLLAGVHVIAALAAGWLVDRFGARRLLPVYLLPLGLASLLLAAAASPYLLPVAMVLIGFTLGGAAATSGALWAELYGTEHLGAIRSVTTAIVVLSTAVAPGLVGVLLDRGVELDLQLGAMAAYCLAAAIWLMCLAPQLDRLASADRPR